MFPPNCRALAAQIEVKDAAIAEARSGKAAPAPGGPAVGLAPASGDGPERGALPRDTPEDLDRLVKDWLAKVGDYP